MGKNKQSLDMRTRVVFVVLGSACMALAVYFETRSLGGSLGCGSGLRPRHWNTEDTAATLCSDRQQAARLTAFVFASAAIAGWMAAAVRRTIDVRAVVAGFALVGAPALALSPLRATGPGIVFLPFFGWLLVPFVVAHVAQGTRFWVAASTAVLHAPIVWLALGGTVRQFSTDAYWHAALAVGLIVPQVLVFGIVSRFLHYTNRGRQREHRAADAAI